MRLSFSSLLLNSLVAYVAARPNTHSWQITLAINEHDGVEMINDNHDMMRTVSGISAGPQTLVAASLTDRGLQIADGWADKQSHLVVASVSDQNSRAVIRWYSQNQGGWTNWLDIGGKFNPTLGHFRINNTVHLAGITPAGALLTKSFNKTDQTFFPSQNSWIFIDEIFNSSLAVAVGSHDNKTVSYFAIGLDRRLYVKTYDPTNQFQSDLVGLADNVISAPAVVSGAGTINVFVNCADGKMYNIGYSSNGWASSPQSLGGNFTRAPSAVSIGKRIDVFGVGANNGSLNHRTWSGSSWSEWVTKDAGILQSVSPAWQPDYQGQPLLRVLAQKDQQVEYHLPFDGKSPWSDAYGLGGVLAGTTSWLWWPISGGRMDSYGINSNGNMFYELLASSWYAWTQWDGSFKVKYDYQAPLKV